MKDIKYVVFLIENGTNKIIDTKLCKSSKDLFNVINDTDFEKLNCVYNVFKEINVFEILHETIKYI